MMEVVFGSSAAGSLAQAAHFGRGPFRGGGIGIVYGRGSGAENADVEEMRRKAVVRARVEWESAVPLELKRSDIFCLELALSIGDISAADFWAGRREAFEKLYSVWPVEESGQQIDEKLSEVRARLALALSRSASGEEMRIWYSDNPDETCALYWLMAELRGLRGHGGVHAVKIPAWEERRDGTVVWKSSCGELGPGDWGRYVSRQRPLPDAFIAGCAMHWQKLREESSPLRAVLNGRLVSSGEDIYDSFIFRELEKAEAEFVEARLIGDVLGKYQLGIGDAWLHFRIEEMIRRGELEAVTAAPEGGPVYRRRLRKRKG